MAIAFDHSYGFNRLTGNQTTGTLGSVTLTTGNLAILTVECYRLPSDTILVTDSNGNTWTKVPNTFVQNNHNPGDPDFGSFMQQLWYSNITNGGSGITITATFPITVNYPALYGCEVSGASVVDQSTSAMGNGVPSSGNITTTAANTFIYGSVYDDGGGSSAAGSGWTSIQHQFNQYLNEYQIPSVTGTFAATTNQAGTVQFSAAIVAFKAPTPPVPGSVNPTSGVQSVTYPNFTVTGTNFDSGGTSTLSFSGSGITVNSYGTRNGTTLTASITIAGGATLGARDVIITNASTLTGTLLTAFSVIPFVPADILVPLPFSDRLTACTAVFPCLLIASPQGAQTIPTSIANLSALSLAYAQLVSVYSQLINTDTANDRFDLNAEVNTAVTVVGNLNTTLQAMTATGDTGVKLANLRVVVYNALTVLQKVQEDEFGTPF